MKLKVLALSLIFMLSICGTGFAASEEIVDFDTLDVMSTEVESPSTAVMSSLDLTSTAGKTLNFSETDFLSCVNEGYELKGIVITSLPANGTLMLDNHSLLAGEAVTIAAVGSMSFVPTDNSAGKAAFTFLPVLSTGVHPETIKVSLKLSSAVNHAPIAENISIKTYKNIAVNGYFQAKDTDGDEVTYKIVSKPKRGDINILENGEFTYAPFMNKTGSDKISYVAVDTFGNTSAEATLTVSIDKPTTKTTYADMEGNSSHYAAIKLVENDVFIGEQLCGSFYFSPSASISRGEFIAMTLKAVGIEDVSPTLVTGFSDDELTPAWVKPYALAALKAGIISGSETMDGRKQLNSSRPISLAEAVVIINKAIQVANVNQTLDENIAVPVWAAQAAVNLDSVGIIKASSESWETTLTRASSAELLSRAIDVFSETKEKSGLLSWVFGWNS